MRSTITLADVFAILVLWYIADTELNLQGIAIIAFNISVAVVWIGFFCLLELFRRRVQSVPKRERSSR